MPPEAASVHRVDRMHLHVPRETAGVPGTAANLAASTTGGPIFVFGSDLGGHNDNETASLAGRLHGADPQARSGPTGQAYAIPYRSSAGQLLPAAVIRNYVDSFARHAAAHSGTAYRIARFACESGAHDDRTMAALFARVPPNCLLPGLWARTLDPRLPARLLVLDLGANLNQPAWQARLQRYLSLNAPLWGATDVELVSAGPSRMLVANDAAARGLKLRHVVFGPNASLHGQNADIAAEYHALWYATHLLNIMDFDGTSEPRRIRLLTAARRQGLVVEQLDTNTF
jgi:hypothetical protein